MGRRITVLMAVLAMGTPVVVNPGQRPAAAAGEDLAAVTSFGHLFGGGKAPKILAMGDSTTYGINGDGSGGRGGYRYPLLKLIAAKHWNYRTVGPRVGPPSGARHAGYPGYQIDDLEDGVPGVSMSAAQMAATYRPDIVLLQIGTNNFIFGNRDPASASREADKLIDQIVAARPTASVFVARIIDSYRPRPNPAVQVYNARVAAHVAALTARGKHVYSVDVHAAVTRASDLGDTIHPTEATYGRMAKIWFNRLSQVNSTGH